MHNKILGIISLFLAVTQLGYVVLFYLSVFPQFTRMSLDIGLAPPSLFIKLSLVPVVIFGLLNLFFGIRLYRSITAYKQTAVIIAILSFFITGFFAALSSALLIAPLYQLAQ